jgi:hypothetical protein
MSAFKRVLVIGAITATGLAASIGSTAHAAAAPGLRVVAHSVNGPRVTGGEKVKNTSILPRNRASGGYKFSPNHVRVPDCSNPQFTDSFNVTNNTTISQSIVFEGSVIATLDPGQEAGFCGENGPGQIQVSLQADPSTVLTINIVH